MVTRTLIDSDALAELLQHDPQAAFARVREAAQAGQVKAQLLLAQMHMEGKGTTQDASAALLWYETAANNGAPPTPGWTGACTTWPTCWPPAAAFSRTARRHWPCTPVPRTWATPNR